MILELQTFLIVCPLVFLGGFVDAVAGGGGLISLPAYLLAGVPVHSALATNKISSFFGTCVSVARYWKNKCIDISLAGPSVVAALAGSALGTRCVLSVDGKILQYLLIIVLPVVAYAVFKNKNYDARTEIPFTKITAMTIAFGVSFGLAFYDGFYGPGTGTFLVLAYHNILKLDIRTASGNAKLVNLSSNIGAAVVFIMNGKALLLLGIVAAVFGIAGNYIGSGLVIKNGGKLVRPIILVVLGLLFIKIIYDGVVNNAFM